MPPKRSTFPVYLRAAAPVLLLILLALTALTAWLVRKTAYPQSPAYLVTPDDFRELDARGLKVTNETWANTDGTQARGWLLRGNTGAPAVLLLHSSNTDRSWLLNLGVTLNAATNYTVLWTDARGHGPQPPVNWTSFGTQESADVASALNFLRGVKTADGQPYIGANIGLYGLEMGGYAGLSAATLPENAGVRVLVLDSVPASPEYVLQKALTRRIGSDNGLFRLLAQTGTKVYLRQSYQNMPACTAAAQLVNRHILLLAGTDEPALQTSTNQLAACLPAQNNITRQLNLPRTGFSLPYLPGPQGDSYQQLVIDFFAQTLANPEISPRFRFPNSAE